MDDYREPVRPVRPPAPYLGGKRVLAPEIIKRQERIPHRVYIEPFIGMGGVFFRRPWRSRIELINDRNGEVVNLFRILQRHYAAFLDHLKFQLTSRREFERLARTDPSTLTDLERAARFLYLQRTAYGGKVTGQSFGIETQRSARFDPSVLAAILEEVYERLSGVTIEGLDWADMFTRYDAPDALFYLDPPYWGNETDYGRDVFAPTDFARISEVMRAAKGFVMLSLNDCAGVRETFDGLPLETFELDYMIGQAQAGPKGVTEVLITNRPIPNDGLF